MEYKGKRTYIVCTLMFVYAVAGGLLGQLESPEVIQLILEAGAIAGLRAGMVK